MRTILDKYLNQICIHKVCTGLDSYGQPTYDESLNILKCRKIQEKIYSRDNTKDFLLYQHVYYLRGSENIKVQDCLDDYIITDIIPWVNFSGQTIGYKVVLSDGKGNS